MTPDLPDSTAINLERNRQTKGGSKIRLVAFDISPNARVVALAPDNILWVPNDTVRDLVNHARRVFMLLGNPDGGDVYAWVEKHTVLEKLRPGIEYEVIEWLDAPCKGKRQRTAIAIRHSRPRVYPECEKMRAVQERSQSIGEFLSWLKAEHAVVFSHWNKWDALVPMDKPVERLLAEFFGISLAKVEDEKRQILRDVRELNAYRAKEEA